MSVWPIVAGIVAGLGLFAVCAVLLMVSEARAKHPKRGTSVAGEIGSGHGDDS